MIYTGYFAQLNKYKEAGLTPISIARKTPAWFEGYSLPELAPSSDLLWKWKSGTVSEDYYKAYYFHQLEQVHWGSVAKKLSVYGSSEDVILLCYEKPSDFCHRHLLAEYLTVSGLESKEYEVKKK